MKLLIANRGEIALRIIRTATELGIDTVAVYAGDDADNPDVHAAGEAIALAGTGALPDDAHAAGEAIALAGTGATPDDAHAAGEAIALAGTGATPYLDHSAILAAAKESGADYLHPGYGFLSENAAFARACAADGVTFVGPDPAVLDLFGDKSSARATAVAAGVPVLPATEGPTTAEEIRAFFGTHPGAIMIKALAGGGGRGMRVVRAAEEIDDAYRQCGAEAQLGFGNPAVFAELLFENARHIEVQIVATGGRALALGDRDCSVQRRHQKLLEIAPAQGLSETLRRELHLAAARLCAHVGYRGLATVEFLVSDAEFVFLEVNPRIQVEHTVTEEVTGVDLVAVQLAIAQGAHFDDLGLPRGIVSDGTESTGDPAVADGIAIQARVNMETMAADGSAVPTAGTLTTFAPPTGPGVRVDTFGRSGLTPSPRYDSLLAKVITRTRGQSFPAAARKTATALAEFTVTGIGTNISFLREILADSTFQSGLATTGFLTERLTELVAAAQTDQPEVAVTAVELYPGQEAVRAQLAGTVVEVADEGVDIGAGGQLVVLEAMKMQHVLAAPDAARVVRVLVRPGRVVAPGDPLVIITRTGADETGSAHADLDPDRARADVDEIRARHRVTLDESRPAAVEKRHRIGRRTARENIADLVDEGSFVEYGALTFAAQRTRRTEEDLIANTPADGLITGLATIGAEHFDHAEAVVISYDYTVLAGTQGKNNHAKTDRAFELAERKRVPVVLFAEGGGGRPGDTDWTGMGLEVTTFRALGALRGKVPLVTIVSGRCFAGNAALAGSCDVIIATPDANIGMGGPAMIEGGGLGAYRPEDIGPIDVQRRNGVVDLVARDEAHAVALAKQYLGYFQGRVEDFDAPDPRLARHVVPENRLRAYDIHRAIDAIVDVGSVLELRPDYGVGVVTALVRVHGEPFGLIANSSHHLGGAIDAEAADKMGDFLTLCQSFGLPIVSLCDTPGFMVGPEAEKTATVRRFSKLFVLGAQLSVPFGTIILRKGYGLGAMAMTAGHFRAPNFTLAWPTGEIGPMGLEGAVRLGFSKELAAVADPDERETLFQQLLTLAYQQGKALTAATGFELDDVIDPADTRRWIATLVNSRARAGS